MIETTMSAVAGPETELMAVASGLVQVAVDAADGDS